MAKSHKHISPLKFFERILELPTAALVSLWAIMVLAFAAAYFSLSSVLDGANGVNSLSSESIWLRAGDALYFSVITATTLGYGDIIPVGFSRALAATESIIGFLLFAVIISKLVSRKQEIALYNVHKLAFQDSFFNTREGFYIIRRDCDLLYNQARDHKSLGSKSWSNLCVVFQKGQTLIEGLLDFYDDFDLYTIDARRERLLIDAVQRTLSRLLHLLRYLDEAGIDWRNHADCAEEPRNLVSVAEHVVHAWRSRSPHSHGGFHDLLTLSRELSDLVAK